MAELQLALCEDEKTAQWVCANSDDTDPRAPVPRLFRNAIMAVAPTGAAFSGAVDRAQRLLAAEAIERDHKTGDASKLVREQLQRVKPELQKQFRLQTCRAFDRVVLADGHSYPLDEQFQVADDQILQHAHGQACLRKFLEAKELIYKPGEALDVGRFLNRVLPGTTPMVDQPEVYTARAIHERFLATPGLRLLPDGSVVRQTILRAVQEGKVVVRLADGRAYDASGCVQGPEGQRRRGPGQLTTLTLDDSVLVTRADSPSGLRWVTEDAPTPGPGGDGRGSSGGGGTPPPPPPARVTATTWNQVLEYARTRPLVELRLLGSKPTAAASLVSLAQPLGADTLALSVSVGGSLKDGGAMHFAANDVKPSHPARPLAIAQTLFNALADGATYEAELVLGFGGAGRNDLESQLQTLAENGADAVAPRATFEKPVEGGA